MGDVIHAIPVAHAIKRVYPNSRIGWVIQAGLESLLEGDPAVDEIIRISIPSTSSPDSSKKTYLDAAVATYKELKRLRREFKSSRYDLVIDLHASFRSGLISRVNPGAIRYGLADAKELNTFFHDELIELDPSKPHAVDKNLAILGKFGIVSCAEDLKLRLSDKVMDSAERLWIELGAPDNKPVIYANPCARWLTKMWSTESWSFLTEMISHGLDAWVLFGGGKGDIPYIDKIVSGRKLAHAVNVAGKLSPVESAALMSKCSAYVGVDSGPMHIAASLDIPVVAMFGPTDPSKVGPYSKRSVVLRNERLNCLACRKNTCSNPRCMSEIDPRLVYESLASIL